MSKDNTAPRPWAFGEIEEDVIVTLAATYNGWVIHRPHSTREFTKDELALIVRSVNAHDALVESAERLVKTIRENGGFSKRVGEETRRDLGMDTAEPCEPFDSLDAMEVALELAKGESDAK